jgi:mediator of RNA polymerase II transcription subunit 7
MEDAQAQGSDQPAEQQEFKPISKAIFPAPPPFYKFFTTANADAFKKIEAQDPSPKKLPLELAVFRPPPRPTDLDASYPAFDQRHQVSPRAEPPPQEILLFDPESPNLNPAALLTKLTKSLLLNFLELTTILTDNPGERREKMDDIRKIVINVHTVINMYRPHQARESVKEMLEGMLEDGNREMEECDAQKARVQEYLEEVKNYRSGAERENGNVNGVGHTANGIDKEDEQILEARRMWQVISEIAND